MTDQECVDKYFEFLSAISNQGYSQDLMEIASNMLLVSPWDSIEATMDKFTALAHLGLPEREYHYEISQVFNKLMGYD